MRIRDVRRVARAHREDVAAEAPRDASGGSAHGRSARGGDDEDAVLFYPLMPRASVGTTAVPGRNPSAGTSTEARAYVRAPQVLPGTRASAGSGEHPLRPRARPSRPSTRTECSRLPARRLRFGPRQRASCVPTSGEDLRPRPGAAARADGATPSRTFVYVRGARRNAGPSRAPASPRGTLGVSTKTRTPSPPGGARSRRWN